MEKILLLTENGCEDREAMYPYYRFQEPGYNLLVVGPKAKETYNGEHGLTITSDLSPADVNIDDYVGVIVPGGRGPDRMRINKGMVKLIKDAAQKGKGAPLLSHRPHPL